MIRSGIIIEQNYKGYPLLEYDGPGAGYYTSILDRLIERLEYQLQKHGKVLVVRLVVKYPADLSADTRNDCFQYFMEEYRRKLAFHRFSPHYVWCRECHNARNCHYHLVLFLDGNRIPYFSRLTEANELWQLAIRKFNPDTRIVPEQLIYKCPAQYSEARMNHGIMVSRNNRPLQQETIRICSYIAKINTKRSAPFDCNDFHASQLPQNTGDSLPCNLIRNSKPL